MRCPNISMKADKHNHAHEIRNTKLKTMIVAITAITKITVITVIAATETMTPTMTATTIRAIKRRCIRRR